MERVAQKIRKDEPLDRSDLKHWVSYNFLVFAQEDQDRVRTLIEKQQWFWKKMYFLVPPFSYGSYAVLRYQYNFSVIKNLLASSFFIVLLGSLGTYSSEKEMKEVYTGFYNKYRDEVLLPKYRGLKLHNGKKIY